MRKMPIFRGALLAAALLGSALGTHAQTSSSSSSSSIRSGFDVIPAGYVFCANKGGLCVFSNTRTVLYRSCFETLCRDVTKEATDFISCIPEVFGLAASYDARCYVRMSSSSSSSSAPYVTGLVATASTQSGDARRPMQAVDGSLNTRWEASNTSLTTWFQVELPRQTLVKSLEIVEFGSRIKGYAIEYWSGTAWVVAYNSPGPLLGVLPMSTPTVAVRLRITTTPGAQPSISEFRVRGVPM